MIELDGVADVEEDLDVVIAPYAGIGRAFADRIHRGIAADCPDVQTVVRPAHAEFGRMRLGLGVPRGRFQRRQFSDIRRLFQFRKTDRDLVAGHFIKSQPAFEKDSFQRQFAVRAVLRGFVAHAFDRPGGVRKPFLRALDQFRIQQFLRCRVGRVSEVAQVEFHLVPRGRHRGMILIHRLSARAVNVVAEIFQQRLRVHVRVPHLLRVHVIGHAHRLLTHVRPGHALALIHAHFGFDAHQFHIAEMLHRVGGHVPERTVKGFGIFEHVELVAVDAHRGFFLPVAEFGHAVFVGLAVRIVQFVHVTAVVLAVFHIFHPLDRGRGHGAVFLIRDPGKFHLGTFPADRQRQFVIEIEPAGGRIGVLRAFRTLAAQRDVCRERAHQFNAVFPDHVDMFLH